MVKEPQGVLELMAQTEAAWRAEMAACDDVTAPERETLLEALGTLRREYADADYPRREAIQGELRELIRRHEDLSGTGTGPARDDAPHAPVPLGVEAAMPPGGPQVRPQPARTPATAKPDKAPKPPVAGAGARRPESAPRATGPVPHGYPGPTPGPGPGAVTARSEAADAGTGGQPGGPDSGRGEDRDDFHRDWERTRDRDDDGEPAAGWQELWDTARATACRWAALGRLAAEHEVLLRKRETRYAELGVRLGQLSRREGLEQAAGDAGVRERLRQVEQVEAAIRANRDRWDDLRGPG